MTTAWVLASVLTLGIGLILVAVDLWLEARTLELPAVTPLDAELTAVLQEATGSEWRLADMPEVLAQLPTEEFVLVPQMSGGGA